MYVTSRRKRHEEMVKDKVVEAEWKYLDVNEHWKQMKNITMETTQVTCGLSKGSYSHKETWWCNEEVAEAVREKTKKYGNWKKEKSTEAWKEYKKSRQNIKRVISLAQWKKQKECLLFLFSFHASVDFALQDVWCMKAKTNIYYADDHRQRKWKLIYWTYLHCGWQWLVLY